MNSNPSHHKAKINVPAFPLCTLPVNESAYGQRDVTMRPQSILIFPGLLLSFLYGNENELILARIYCQPHKNDTSDTVH